MGHKVTNPAHLKPQITFNKFAHPQIPYEAVSYNLEQEMYKTFCSVPLCFSLSLFPLPYAFITSASSPVLFLPLSLFRSAILTLMYL